MDADFVMLWFGVKQDTDLDNLKQIMLILVDELTETDVAEENLNHFNTTRKNLEEHPFFLEQLKTEFKDVIEELFQCIYGREVEYFDHLGETIYVTEGMSFGDSPTDAYDTFEKFLNMPLPIRSLVT